MSEESEINNDDQIKSLYGEGSFDLSLPDMLVPEAEDAASFRLRTIEDEVEGAFKFCFLGAGQGGSRIVETFHKMGYKRVAAINTAEQDLNSIDIEHKLCIGNGGAGKDPDVARKALEEKGEDVLDFMRYSFGDTFDRIFICAGAGGGSGSGMVVPLCNLAREVQEITKTTEKQVGVILTLPKKSEGAQVNKNAHQTLRNIVSLVREKIVSPLIIVDNEKVSQLYPNVAISKFWNVANSNFCGLFHLFNLTSSKDSSYSSFDKNDYKGILNSGIIVFGASPVKDWKDPVAIARTVRENVKSNLLSGGVDVSSGTVAGVIMIGGTEVLDSLPQSYIDQALDQLNRMLKNGNSTVHGGVYSGDKPTLNIFSVVGGVSEPHKKLAEMQSTFTKG
jgi:cell division GTPase FtsZ